MTKLQLIAEIVKLRRRGDPMIPASDKPAMEKMLKRLQERQQKEAR